MDETPIKAGRKTQGRMRAAYFWPLYGEADEISFTYAATRARAHIEATLAEHFAGVLLTNGYAAYARFAETRAYITHAQCWAHTRRGFERALEADPQAKQALGLIATLYRQEAWIRERTLEGPDKLAARVKYCEPSVCAFWQWCDAQCQRLDLDTPSVDEGAALCARTPRRP